MNEEYMDIQVYNGDNETRYIKYEDMINLIEKIKIKQEEKDKEIERLREENILLKASEPMSKLQEDYGYKAEVERLNNIINTLFEYLKENSKQPELFESDRYYEDILDKLQELLGSDKE